MENKISEKIAVIIPMYNVESHIAEVIQTIPDSVAFIIAIDDCSIDNTWMIVNKIYDKRLILLQHKKNTGVGGAMQTGFQAAIDKEATIIVKIDGDGQMPILFLDDLLVPILNGKADFTKGNRFANMEEIISMPTIRRIGNLGLSFVTKVASGYWNIFDPTNGFFAMDVTTLKRLRLETLHKRYFFESSLLCTLYRVGAVVMDIPMPAVYANERSSLSAGKSLLEFPPLLFTNFLKRIWLRYFVLDFSVASISLIFGMLFLLFGGIWGIYYWWKSMVTNIPATAGTVIIAALPVILGFQLILQFLSIDIQNVPYLPKNRRIH
ncbi:MAG: glycosyltransferase family 2 protein [Anaerolineaceae bacterium]|nr:glycosyltransferase family 2 protein [Anaerolineaceae bacterium]